MSSGTCRVMISHAWMRVLRSTKSPRPSFSARGGSQSITFIPRLPANSSTLLPTCPTPTMPSVLPFRSKSILWDRVSRTLPTHWRTEEELHPGALAQAMPCCAHQRVSIWSYPMVAVAMKRTFVPSSRSASQRVLVRIISASASRTSDRLNSDPLIYSTRAYGSSTPRRKGILSSQTIFIFPPNVFSPRSAPFRGTMSSAVWRTDVWPWRAALASECGPIGP